VEDLEEQDQQIVFQDHQYTYSGGGGGGGSSKSRRNWIRRRWSRWRRY
jgi:hypothetical protein